MAPTKQKPKLSKVLKPKPKQKPITEKRLETAEIKELTSKELNNLSRQMIMKWWTKQRLGKLNALQEYLANLDPEERGDKAQQIVEKTSEKLKDLKKETGKLLRIKRFAKEITSIDEKPKSLIAILNKYVRQIDNEKEFFKTLDEHVSKKKDKEILKKVMKLPLIAQLRSALKGLSPAQSHDIDVALKEGDYKGLKSSLVKASGGELSGEYVDKAFAAAMYDTTTAKKHSSLGPIDTLVQWFNRLKLFGKSYGLEKARKSADVPMMLILKFSDMTLSSLIAMDKNLQENKFLIEKKQKHNEQDQRRLVFIAQVHRLKNALVNKMNNSDVQKNFEKALTYYLAKVKEKYKFDDQTISVLRSRTQIQDLRLMQFYEFLFSNDENRENILFKFATKWPILVKFKQRVFSQNLDLIKTLAGNIKRRVIRQDVRHFKRSAESWGMPNLDNKLDDLAKRANEYKPPRPTLEGDRVKITGEELYQHDRILKEYYILVDNTSKILTQKATDIVHTSKALETAKRSVINFETNIIDWKKHPHISDFTLEKLFPGEKAADIRKRKMKGSDLLKAHFDRLVDWKNMQDSTRARFSQVGEVIYEKVMHPFGQEWGKKMDQMGYKKTEMAAIKDDLNTIKQRVDTRSRLVKYGKVLALPAAAIGYQVYNLSSGKVKPREFGWSLVELGVGFIPIAGTIADYNEWSTGRSLSGRRLSKKEQWLSLGFAVIGAIADATSLIGVGLGIRAGLGALKSGRHAVKAARNIDNVHDALKMANPTITQKFGIWAEKRFSKVSKLERSVELSLKAKANEQAALMSKYGVNKVDDVNDLLSGTKKLNASQIADLNKLKKLMTSAEGGGDYLAMFKKWYGEASVSVPKGWLGRQWTQTKAGFHRIRSWLAGKGVDKNAINAYEESFDSIRKAEASKLKAVENFNELQKKTHIRSSELLRSQDAYNATRTTKSDDILDLVRKDAKYAEDIKLLEANNKVLSNNFKELRGELGNKKLKKLHGKLGRAKSEVARKEIIKQMEKANAKLPKNKQVDDLGKKLADFQKLGTEKNKLAKLKKDYDKTQKAKLSADNDLLANAERFKGNEDELKTLSNNLKNGQEAVEIETKSLIKLNAARYEMEAKFMMDTERTIRNVNAFATATRFAQYGLMAGAISFMTNTNAVSAAKTVGKGAYTGVSIAYKGGVYILTEDHSGRDALDVAVQKMVWKQKAKKDFGAYVAAQKKRKKSVQEILENNADNAAAQAWARANGQTKHIRKGLIKNPRLAYLEYNRGSAKKSINKTG